MPTAYHAKYFAHDLTKRGPPGAADQLSMALFDASVDLNPHQIEAAMFALQSPLAEGVILADEVGLGKTIEAGIVLCQKWAERKRKLLIICPASIRQQWAAELTEKFNLPAMVLDAKTYRALKRDGQPRASLSPRASFRPDRSRSKSRTVLQRYGPSRFHGFGLSPPRKSRPPPRDDRCP